MSAASDAEEVFYQQINELPPSEWGWLACFPAREFKFAAPERQWRLDFAWQTFRLAVEIEGVTFYGKQVSRHQTTTGFRGDCEKYNEALLRGWRVLRFTHDQMSVKLEVDAAGKPKFAKGRMPKAMAEAYMIPGEKVHVRVAYLTTMKAIGVINRMEYIPTREEIYDA